MANLTLLAGGALFGLLKGMAICLFESLTLWFCVVRELSGFGGLDAWTPILLLADLWNDGGDDADNDDEDEDEDEPEESRTRLLPTIT